MSQGSNVAQKHYLDGAIHDEVVAILVEFSGCLVGQAQQNIATPGLPDGLTHSDITNILSVYVQNHLVKSVPATAAVASGQKCKHVFVKGKHPGQECGKTANFIGKEGLPKCSSHKSSRPVKNTGHSESIGAPTGSFSYADNLKKGTTTPQDLTAIEAAINNGSRTELVLEESEDGILYNRNTTIAFKKVGEGDDEEYIAYGIYEDGVVIPLEPMDKNVCNGNVWKYDDSLFEQKEDDDIVPESSGNPLIKTGVFQNQQVVTVMANAFQ